MTPNAAARKAPTKVGMISLGCAKNLVDAEVMLGDAASRGMEITADASEADVLVVNTCAFIDSAKEESIEAILQAHRGRGLRKKAGQKLIVSGCMAQRFSKELAADLNEVDAFIGLDQVNKLGEIVEGLIARPSFVHDDDWQPLNLVTRNSTFIPDYDTPRFRLTPSHTAYVKIAEGCNHPCSFCVIPRMRGRHRSRTIASVVAEVRHLVAGGVREINLISQDTTYFGMDHWEQRANPTQPVDSSRGPTLAALLRELQAIEGDFWIRLLYTHPAHWSDELIATIAGCDKVARYIDMPLQHIHEEMLLTMRRETTRRHIEDLIARLRAGIPGLALRTTFIVGFPGETDEHFQSLLEFIGRVRFERLGVFTYSQEESSRAAKMPGQISAKVKQARFRKAMRLQQGIAREIAEAQIGKTLRVLVEKPQIARAEADAPDVDTQIFLDTPAAAGDFANVRITGARVYDLEAEVV
ncbi:MAG TPA: 30S ribosomal protein S12 methylthiotransferase RimO [Chthoniobacteraceae bacterium]|jgi:ribosomal protein S12 methylthiotransferase|nr:30S ribosomal protein S12 methylthiotransferase RimO [Chthoniobacteraceae bacterium]